MELRIREVDIEASAKPKGSNGGVAVGLPHRNYSVFKQTPINQWQIKVVVVKTRANEAKGPFPGGKRVGSWGKKREMVGITLRRLGVGGRKR